MPDASPSSLADIASLFEQAHANAAKARADEQALHDELAAQLGKLTDLLKPAVDPAPVPVPAGPSLLSRLGKAIGSIGLTKLLLLGLALVVAYDHRPHVAPGPGPSPSPAPAYNAVTEGHGYGVDLARTYADAVDAARAILRAPGAKFGDAQARLKASWAAAHEAAFAKRFGPRLNSIVPDGQEPATDAARAAYDAELGLIAQGARGVK